MSTEPNHAEPATAYNQIAAGMEKSQRGAQISLATLRPKLASCEKALADAEAELTRLRSLAAAGEKVVEVLERAKSKLRYLGRVFTGPNFTDRGGDGPKMLDLADDAEKALSAYTAAKSQSEPKP